MTDWYADFRRRMLTDLARILGVEHDALPAVFLAEGRPKALKIGIHQDLIDRYPDANRKQIRAWLGRWTHPIQYQTRLVHGTNRHDLDGNDVDLITDEQRTAAEAQIKIIQQKMQARRRVRRSGKEAA